MLSRIIGRVPGEWRNNRRLSACGVVDDVPNRILLSIPGANVSVTQDQAGPRNGVACPVDSAGQAVFCSAPESLNKAFLVSGQGGQRNGPAAVSPDRVGLAGEVGGVNKSGGVQA
jgi:hypothetical protein